jgi:hypothetical protein
MRIQPGLNDQPRAKIGDGSAPIRIALPKLKQFGGLSQDPIESGHRFVPLSVKITQICEDFSGGHAASFVS